MNLGEGFKLLKASMVYKVWGGTKLTSLKGMDASEPHSEPLGEAWEISNHPDGPSMLGDKPLGEFLSTEELPYLVKLIDTSDYLSVQVHPDDKFARTHENSQGKTECWIILGAQKGCGIYLGMKPGVTKEEFEMALVKGEEMDKFLTFYPVKKGDFFFVPAGSIHAIGKGVFLAEVQQSSGITYRVWDWNRVDAKGESRVLHVDKAMQVIRFGDDFNNLETFKAQKETFNSGISNIIEHPQFNLRQISLEAGERLEVELDASTRAKGILNLDGRINIDNEEVKEYHSLVGVWKNKETVKIEAIERGSLLLVE